MSFFVVARAWLPPKEVPTEVASNEVIDWTEAEVDAIVTDYFDMLRLELDGKNFNKTEHRSRLLPRLNERSHGSVEFKHSNISAILVDHGLPYIDGYKPRGNFQLLLSRSVEEFLVAHPSFLEEMENSPKLNPVTPPDAKFLDFQRVFEDAPEKIIGPDNTAQPWLSRRGRAIDFARRDAENRHMGKLGEKFAVELEKRRLVAAGRDDLSSKVEWIAETKGDGIGFDVFSFEDDETERLVEVKTTGNGKYFPFYVTSNEVRCSEAMETKYHLFRVFDFSVSPRVFVLHGSLSTKCKLEPIQYRATI